MSITDNPQTAIILLTMNQRDITLRCLKSLAAVTEPSHKIVLWDNGSQDGTIETVQAQFPDVLTHHHPKNIGVASGRNAAVKLALEKFQPTYLFFMDNDMTVEPDFLTALVEPFSQDPRIAQTAGKIKDMADTQRLYGAAGCRINFITGDTRHIGFTELDEGQYDQPQKCIPSGGCMLVRTDVFQQLNGFDPIFNPYGPEDHDFGFRVLEAGYYAWYTPDAVVYHDSRPGRTYESGQYSANFAFHRVRNWFLFMRRHASFLQKVGFFVIGIPMLLAGFVYRQYKRGVLWSSIGALLRGSLKFVRLSLGQKR